MFRMQTPRLRRSCQMKKYPFVILALLLWSVSLPAANNPADEKAVMATLETMAKATIAKDVATLAKIYSDDVTYSHSNSQNDTKAEVLKAVQGPNQAEFMKFSDTKIRIYGDVALAKGVSDFRNGAPGK